MPSDGDVYLRIQPIDAGGGWHLDLHIDDVEQLVADHESLGEANGDMFQHWTAMVDRPGLSLDNRATLAQRPPTRLVPTAGSTAIDGNLQRLAQLSHSGVVEPPESLGEHPHRHAFDRVQVGNAGPRYRIRAGLQGDFACEPPNSGCARSDECSTEARDGGVSGKDYDRPASRIGQLAPPDISTHRRAHDAAALSRNDARSPHSSGESRGTAS